MAIMIILINMIVINDDDNDIYDDNDVLNQSHKRHGRVITESYFNLIHIK